MEWSLLEFEFLRHSLIQHHLLRFDPDLPGSVPTIGPFGYEHGTDQYFDILFEIP